MLGGVSPHFCTLIFCFVQIYVFQNLTFSFSYYSKMCCNILREDDSEIISPLFKKKPIQLKDLFWWKKYVIYFFLVETMKFYSLILRHTLNWVGASDGFGCQKSGSGRVRVSLTRVWVEFGCQMSGFVRVRVIFVGFSGFSGVEKFLKFWPLLLFLMHFYAWIFFKLQKIYNFEKNNVKKKFHLMKNLVLFGKNF